MENKIDEMRAHSDLLQARLAAAELALCTYQKERALMEEISDTIEIESLLNFLAGEIECCGEFSGCLLSLADLSHERQVGEVLRLRPECADSTQAELKEILNGSFSAEVAECCRLRQPVYADAAAIERFCAVTGVLGMCWPIASLVVMPIGASNPRPLGTLIIFHQQRAVLPQEIAAAKNRLRLFEKQLRNVLFYHEARAQKQDVEALNHSLEQRVEELCDLATKDRLTGLNNFGFFVEELDRRMHEYRRQAKPNELSLVILDVDHFKKFNDTHGHQAGNIALQEVARRIALVARKMDVACRFGGEEFAIVLPKCNLEGARIFAERLRQDVESKAIALEGNEVWLTASLGCSQFRMGEDISSFVERADQALYRAKGMGRNRVEISLLGDEDEQLVA